MKEYIFNNPNFRDEDNPFSDKLDEILGHPISQCFDIYREKERAENMEEIFNNPVGEDTLYFEKVFSKKDFDKEMDGFLTSIFKVFHNIRGAQVPLTNRKLKKALKYLDSFRRPNLELCVPFLKKTDGENMFIHFCNCIYNSLKDDLRHCIKDSKETKVAMVEGSEKSTYQMMGIVEKYIDKEFNGSYVYAVKNIIANVSYGVK